MREKTKLFYFCKKSFEDVFGEVTRPKTKEAALRKCSQGRR